MLRRDVRGGFCAAVNAGLRATRGDVVQILNDDAEVTGDFAEPALRRFADPRIPHAHPRAPPASSAAGQMPRCLQNASESRRAP